MAKRRTIRRRSDSDERSSSRRRSSSSSRRSSSSYGRRRSTSRRSPRRTQRKAQPIGFDLDPRTKREALGLGLLVLALITLVGLFSGSADGTGSALQSIVRLMFGWGGFLLAIGMGIFGVLILLSEFRGKAHFEWNDVLGGILLFIAVLGLLALPQAGMETVSDGGRGGLLGHTVSHALVVTAGLRGFGAFFVLAFVALVGAMLTFDISVKQLIALGTIPTLAIAQWIHETRTRRSVVIRTSGSDAVPRRRQLALEGELLPAPKDIPLSEEEGEESEEEEGEEKEEPFPRIIGRTDRQAAMATARPANDWHLPTLDLLEMTGEAEVSQAEIRRQARVIEETLASFNVQARVVEVNCGPTVTQFALQPGVGVKVSKITALSNDLALALSASSIRLEAPVPGRPVIGVEIPNSAISTVSLREILESQTFQEKKGELKVALGRDVSGQAIVDDLTKMPHMLIAGTTGSGKSVCINALVVSFLYQHSPDSLRFIMIDPKRVELSIFQDIPHLAFPVVTEINGRRAGSTQPGAPEQVDALKALLWATQEMERRYKVFAREGFRNIAGYNKAARAQQNPNLPPMPFVVVVIDELADLMMVAPDEAETMICRLAQLARATGIHLVLATQRPSVDVVTGLIKANFPSRISFAVSSSIDSRVVLDTVGAEQLLGRGDALYMAPDSAKPLRIQGSYVSDEEIEKVVNFWKEQRGEEPIPIEPVQLTMPLSWHEEAGESEEPEPEDELLPEAIALVRKHNRASAALLQRRLRVSYNRAARLIDLLEVKGVVGPEEQGRSREVLQAEGGEGRGEEEDFEE